MSDVSDGDASGAGLPSICAAVGLDASRLITVQQVHGNTVVVADEVSPGPNRIEADAIIVSRPGMPVAVHVADCVPIWIYATGPGIGAVIHAGREGTLRRISETVVDKLTREFRALPASMRVFIGPSAGPCCYEVSSTIAEAWRAEGLVAEGRYLDLWRSNARQFESMGIVATNIELSRVCTICTNGFHSYRRTGTKERNAAILSI